MSGFEDRLRLEFQDVLRGTVSPSLIQPTPEEIKNGWTPESLTAYLADQDAAASLKIDPKSALNRGNRKPVRANSRYRVFQWRR